MKIRTTNSEGDEMGSRGSSALLQALNKSGAGLGGKMTRYMTRRRSSSLFGLRCGCKESVSVSASDTSDKSAVTPLRVRDPSAADTLTLTFTSPASSSSSSSCWVDEEKDAEKPESSASFSGLLRQLSELEENVKAWGRPPAGHNREESKTRWPRHRRSGRRIEESVAVVKESADPLGDFRISMLQMIVEKEIVDGDELRELLHRFLSLNSTRHHDLILQAFAEIWAEVFSGCENTLDLLRRSSSSSSSQTLHF